MKGKIVFLLEEPSMRELLECLLPRLFPGLVFQCVAHEGKSDLDRSLPRKLSAWREPGVRFVVVRDNDNADCRAVKQRIMQVCAQSGRPDTLIRLVCQELESWYIGDLAAVERAYPGCRANTNANNRRYLDPDVWQKPSQEMKRIIPDFQKVDGARRLGQQLSGTNQSHSFRVFLAGIGRIAAEMGYAGGVSYA